MMGVADLLTWAEDEAAGSPVVPEFLAGLSLLLVVLGKAAQLL